MSVTFEIVEDPARACAALMVGAASAGGGIVLAGGSTPKAAYVHFVEAVRTTGLDLAGTTFWVGDERCVAADDDRSNLKMIRETLLEALPGPPPPIHPMRGELGPEQGARDYAAVIAQAGDPRFALMLLGIGPDGHTLSLFPGQATLHEASALVVAVPEAGHEPLVPRISLSLPAVGLADHAVLLVSGEGKADAVARAFGPEATPDPRVPSSLLPAHARELTVLMDAAAASKLPEGGGAAGAGSSVLTSAAPRSPPPACMSGRSGSRQWCRPTCRARRS